MFYKVRQYRRLIRLFNFIKVMRDIKHPSSESQKVQAKWVLILSKICYALYFIFDNALVVIMTANDIHPKNVRLNKRFIVTWKIGYLCYTIGVCLSLLFYGLQLQYSYRKEKGLLNCFVDNFKPKDILQVLADLSKERWLFYFNIAKLVPDFFLGIHYSGTSEALFNTKIKKMFLGFCGIVSSTAELFAKGNFAKDYELNELIVKLTD